MENFYYEDTKEPPRSPSTTEAESSAATSSGPIPTQPPLVPPSHSHELQPQPATIDQLYSLVAELHDRYNGQSEIFARVGQKLDQLAASVEDMKLSLAELQQQIADLSTQPLVSGSSVGDGNTDTIFRYIVEQLTLLRGRMDGVSNHRPLSHHPDHSGSPDSEVNSMWYDGRRKFRKVQENDNTVDQAPQPLLNHDIHVPVPAANLHPPPPQPMMQQPPASSQFDVPFIPQMPYEYPLVAQQWRMDSSDQVSRHGVSLHSSQPVVNHHVKEEKRDSLEIPQYKMKRSLKSISDIWQEWEYGFNDKPPVKQLELQYGTKWRNETESRTFLRRKKIYEAIEIGRSKGFTEQQIISDLEDHRSFNKDGTIKKHPLSWLVINLPEKYLG